MTVTSGTGLPQSGPLGGYFMCPSCGFAGGRKGAGLPEPPHNDGDDNAKDSNSEAIAVALRLRRLLRCPRPRPSHCSTYPRLGSPLPSGRYSGNVALGLAGMPPSSAITALLPMRLNSASHSASSCCLSAVSVTAKWPVCYTIQSRTTGHAETSAAAAATAPTARVAIKMERYCFACSTSHS